MSSNTYTCAMCGGTFDKGWSDEEALAEMHNHFGNPPPEEQAVVCDDCYKKIDPATHPYEVEEAVAESRRIP